MTNEELTAEVAQLEHFLFDVWRWDDLYAIAQDRQGLALSLEPYEPGYRTEANAIAAQLNALLSDRLAAAIAEADNVLSTLPAGPVRAALVAGLLDRQRGLQQPRACWRQWTEQDPHRYAEQQEAEEHEGVPTPADAWAGIEGDVHRYVAQLVAHIEGHNAEVEQAGPQLDRARWTGTASELAYLLTELVEAEHLVPPARGRKKGKDGNRAAIAEAIYRAFDIRDRDTGEPVTLDYFKSLLRPNSPDRGAHTELFKIRSRTAAK
jgi:hypothetical protein